MGNRTDGAGVHFQSKHIKINIQKDIFFLQDYLCLIFFFFSKAQIKPVLYLCASGKTERKAKCCVCSTAASPLLPQSCLNAVKKGLRRSFAPSRHQQRGEKELEDKMPASAGQGGQSPVGPLPPWLRCAWFGVQRGSNHPRDRDADCREQHVGEVLAAAPGALLSLDRQLETCAGRIRHRYWPAADSGEHPRLPIPSGFAFP